MKKIRISELPLSESTKGLYLLATDKENQSVKVSMDSMEEERAAADEELLLRIKGVSKRSTAYTDPSIYIGNFDAEKNESGGIKKAAVLVMQDFLRDTVRHSDYRDSFPYIGKMRGHVQGIPFQAANYVKQWNTGSQSGIFVQVVRTNFGINNGVISSALTEAFHEYHRAVTVSMANGNVMDVTATAWKESTADIRAIADEGLDKADSALSQIHEERQERAAQDRSLAEAVSNERSERTAADANLQAKIAILVPSALTVEAPRRITWGNVAPIAIKAVLSPVTAMRNLIYLSDNKAVEVSTYGVLTPVAKGVSRVHVIPTQNTALARTCVIEVGDPRLRLSSLSALRFTQAGGFRLT